MTAIKTVKLFYLATVFTLLALNTGTLLAGLPVSAQAVIGICPENQNDTNVVGKATLIEQPSAEGIKQVQIYLWVRGLAPGKHAVHIHETADCMPCSEAGGHFDPGPNSNTSPDGNHPFHSGDLINIRVNDNGVGYMSTTTSRVTLSDGPLSVFDADGSAFIIHVNEDTYCPEGSVSGCAGGARAACGIIIRD